MVVLVFVLGLIIGSFLNAFIHRSAAGGSIFDTSSRCPKCVHKLTWLDLIPLVSFFVLRGKCRYCGKPISWQYPMVEFATGLGFVLIASNFQFPISNFQFWAQTIFSCFLIVTFVYDLKHYLILDKVVVTAAILAFIYQGYQGDWGNALLGAALLSGFFAVLYLASQGRWIGAGDVKLGIFLGLLVPWPETLVLFLLAYLLGAVVSLGFIVHGSKTLKDHLPFGTFLTAAAFIAMLWGEAIMSWYLRLIGLS